MALQRAYKGQLPCGGLPPLSHWVTQRWAARKVFRHLPSLGMLFYPLTLLYASQLSASLVQDSSSHNDASALPPPEAQSQLAAYCHWVAIGGRSPLCQAPSFAPEAHWRVTECN